MEGDTCLDGIVNNEMYNSTQPRVLWVLKEPNWGGDSEGVEKDIDGLEDSEIKKLLLKKKEDMHHYYRDVTKCNRWRSTFWNIMYITHGILEKIYLFNDMVDVDNKGLIEGKYYLDNIAFINVKKHPGGSKSNGGMIADNYRRHKEILHKQIQLINPDIVFNCSGVIDLVEDLSGKMIVKEEYYSFPFVHTGSMFVIHTYHPLNMGTSLNNQDYVNENLRIVKNYVENVIKF